MLIWGISGIARESLEVNPGKWGGIFLKKRILGLLMK
jgi:hypothetical protein